MLNNASKQCEYNRYRNYLCKLKKRSDNGLYYIKINVDQVSVSYKYMIS